ncbi:MAG TPA: hypothetical protein VLX68_04340 [Chitinivibrionales bacterium]|nr:hypothetical protein [Chitinivibrionales bacterium]
MVFLWAYNNSGVHDLTTSGLDTFHLHGTTLTHPVSSRLQSSIQNGPMFFKAITGKFFVPSYLQGTKAVTTVYDLAGKMLSKLVLKNEKYLDLHRFTGANGAVVVKVGR